MGLSWSSSRRRNNHHHPNRRHQLDPTPSSPQSPPPPSSNPPPLSITSPQSSSSPPPPRPPPSPPPPPSQQPSPSYAFAANAPYPTPQQTPYQTLPLPSPPSFSSYSHHSNTFNYARPMMGHSNYHPYYSHPGNGWSGFHPPATPPPPPSYVDHQSAKKIKNDVNVHKDTIRVEVDEKSIDNYLVSFTFDAMVDGSITIFYFGKEGANCTFTPLYPEIHMPARIPFQKGLGQKFYQPSGTGIDLGFFDTNDLSKPVPGDTFPLVICAESCLPPMPIDEQLDEPPLTPSPHAQITQAVLEKNKEGHFQVRVIKQILWVDGIRYELREIYGISNSDETTTNDHDLGKECVICMTEPKDTAVLPCRHMCMCSECAKALRLQSDKCPICRQPIDELLEIKVNEES